MHLKIGVVGIGVALSSCTTIVTEMEPEAPVEQVMMVDLDSARMLTEIDRFRTMDPEAARQLHGSLSNQANMEAGLRLVLLERYGPDAVRAPAEARERLRGMKEDLEPFLNEDARRLVNLLHVQWNRQAELDQRVINLSQQLVNERAMHAETRDKLEGLRRIEQEMGNRDEAENGHEMERETDGGGNGRN